MDWPGQETNKESPTFPIRPGGASQVLLHHVSSFSQECGHVQIGLFEIGDHRGTHAVERDASRARPLLRNDRCRRQRRARAHLVGQGRQDALEGSPSQGPRRSHEPGRPPSWWSHTRRTERRQSVGQEGRREDPQQEEVVAAHDRPRSQARQSNTIGTSCWLLVAGCCQRPAIRTSNPNRDLRYG